MPKSILQWTALALTVALAFWAGRQSTKSDVRVRENAAVHAPVGVSHKNSDVGPSLDEEVLVIPVYTPGIRTRVGYTAAETAQREAELIREVEADVVSRLVEAVGPSWGSEISPLSTREGPFVDGVRHGEWTVYHQEGVLVDQGVFFLGAQHGRWTAKDRNGVLLRDRTFFNGQLHGTVRDRISAEESWRHYEYLYGELVE